MRRAITFAVLSCLTLGTFSWLAASPVVTTQVSTANETAFTPSYVNDLILNTAPSFGTLTSPGFTPFDGTPYGTGIGSLSGLNDGTLGTADQLANTALPSGLSNAWTATFTLVGAPYGYNITQIDTYSGWNSIYTNQDYTVKYTTVSNPTPTPIPGPTSGEFSLALGAGGGHISITDTTGVLASGVNSLIFDFLGTSGTLGADDAVMRELTVFGTMAAPEPGSLFMFGAGAVGLLAMARRHRVARERNCANRIQNRALILLLVLSLTLCTTSGLMAMPTETRQIDAASQLGFPLPSLSNDLILNGSTTLTSATLGGTFTPNMGSSPTKLNDGDLGIANTVSTTAFSFGTPYSMTYDLNVSPVGGHVNGYNISSIQSFVGWTSSFVNQDFTVSYTTAGSATPNSLGTFALTPANANGGNPIVGSSLMTITDDSSPFLATNVSSITFAFANEDSLSSTDVYREVVVAGTFAAPEPSGIVLAALGLVALGFAAKQRRLGK